MLRCTCTTRGARSHRLASGVAGVCRDATPGSARVSVACLCDESDGWAPTRTLCRGRQPSMDRDTRRGGNVLKPSLTAKVQRSRKPTCTGTATEQPGRSPRRWARPMHNSGSAPGFHVCTLIGGGSDCTHASPSCAPRSPGHQGTRPTPAR